MALNPTPRSKSVTLNQKLIADCSTLMNEVVQQRASKKDEGSTGLSDAHFQHSSFLSLSQATPVSPTKTAPSTQATHLQHPSSLSGYPCLTNKQKQRIQHQALKQRTSSISTRAVESLVGLDEHVGDACRRVGIIPEAVKLLAWQTQCTRQMHS